MTCPVATVRAGFGDGLVPVDSALGRHRAQVHRRRDQQQAEPGVLLDRVVGELLEHA